MFILQRVKTSAENRRRLSAGYQQHLNIAQLPEDVWSIKSYIDEGFVKSNKHVVSENLQLPVEVDNNTKEVSSEDEIAQGEDDEQYKEKYFTLKILLEHAQLLTKYQQFHCDKTFCRIKAYIDD
ncbi:hypothetical protein DPMN_038833 [Dreissena polymorpha]|uniref:Uncharacterized protein n=1 Tax=Dreissena polymorpha TaxID=45954 RepID=A0A9D4RR25_DREPO|nr:hypothetical protein DPMN_038833 [Dreissena polymorpha]